MMYYIIWNVIVFAMYGIDKYNAMNRKQRISEMTLLLSAFFMGGVGAFFGMQFFRHKTRHIEFAIGVPISILLNFVCFYIFKKVL